MIGKYFKRLLLIQIFLTNCFAQTDAFCRKFSTTHSKSQILSSLIYNNQDEKKENLLRYVNFGGFPQSVVSKMDGWGVCWWHSRFTRAVAYLVKFSPEKKKPNYSGVRNIIQSIAKMNRVVEIPGYANLYEFSTDHYQQIQSELNDWQKRDTFNALGRTLNPLRPSFNSYDKNLWKTFNRLNYLINVEKILPFVVEQIEGITAHSYLVIKAEVRGYTVWEREIVLTLIDSNWPHIKKAILDPLTGDRLAFISEATGQITATGNAIYIDFNRDLYQIERTLKEYCPQIALKITPVLNKKYEY